MPENESKIASGQPNQPTPCGSSSALGCSAVSPIQSAFLNLKSAQRDCEAAADFLGAMEYGDAVVWINSASDLLASAKAKILASQNPKAQGTGGIQ